MQLYSLQFICFLLVLLAVYYLVGRKCRGGQWIVLLVGSLGFYLAAGWQNLFFILLTACSTWLVALRFAKLDARCADERSRAADRKERKAVKQRYKQRKWATLLAALVLNFGVLGYMKYWNVLLGFVGAGDSFLASHLLLPLGISFYTFMSVSYLVDTYNGKYTPERNFARYLLFVSFFPQLIQGPINRYDAMAVQLFENHRFDLTQARRALVLIGFGLLKKYVVADVLVGAVSNALDHVDAGTPGCVVVFGILFYTIQQYGDFSGGIDMVRGASQLFGIEMARNFQQPYFATSLSDFWRRWHMTLGTWMRDYVFYPLAVWPPFLKLNKWGQAHLGKQVGRTLSACLGNIIVFFLVGLWHGAETHYILWGLYNGIVIAASDMLRPVFAWLVEKLRIDVQAAWYHVFSILRTFMLVNIGRYFDRLYDPSDLLTGFHNTLFNFRPGEFASYLSLYPTTHLKLCLLLALVGCVVVFIVSVNEERGIDVRGRVLAAPVVARLVLYVFILTLVAVSFMVSAQTGGGFLYAAF